MALTIKRASFVCHWGVGRYGTSGIIEYGTDYKTSIVCVLLGCM